MPFATIPEALKAFAEGEFLIVIDNPSRENEGDLIISCAHLTPKKMAFMIRYTSGLICVPMSQSRLLELGLPDMVERNEESLRTAYTISCDSREGVTTGISASDRAHTCNVLAKSSTVSVDIVRPGHVFPLRAREGGVLVRDGHTEAAVDLCKLAGLTECAAISEIVRDEDGEMARTEELLRRGEEWGIKVITIEDMKTFRLANQSVTLPANTKLLSSILYSSCSFFLLDLHIERLQRSAKRFGWKVPDAMHIQTELYRAIMGKAHLTLRLRLTLDKEAETEVEVSEMTVQKSLMGPFSSGTPLQFPGSVISSGEPWTLTLDTEPTPTMSLLALIENKTTSRSHYEMPMQRRQRSLKKREEVLLYNERGEVTEGTITNVLFLRSGTWVTPDCRSGLLNGVVRQSLLEAKKIEERLIKKEELVNGETVMMCNGVRGVFPATLVL